MRFQTQLVFLMNRYKQQMALNAARSVRGLRCVRLRVRARPHLRQREPVRRRCLALYERVASELEAKVARPDLAVYLQASAPVLFDRVQIARSRLRARARRATTSTRSTTRSTTTSSITRRGRSLVVNTDAMDFVNDERHFVDLVHRARGTGREHRVLRAVVRGT